MPKFLVYPGAEIGRLTIIKEVNRIWSGGWRRQFLCQCSCGSDLIVRRKDCLANGNTQSCGCFAQERNKQVHTKHGYYIHPEVFSTYQSWYDANRRCYNPRSKDYPNYGGRGIQVCERWQGPTGFQNFLEDMGSRPDGLTLDRSDTDKDYEPNNCSWATRRDQNNNKRNNRKITYNGKTQTLAQWSREVGISGDLIQQRIDRDGWTVARALTMLP